MDWDRVQGSWKQLEGKIKAKWGKLTADDLTAINGRREQLEGKLQQRYGLAKDQVRKEIDDWFTSQGFWRKPLTTSKPGLSTRSGFFVLQESLQSTSPWSEPPQLPLQ
jgi:uncharacterized protein YjbJ (UPF0337 family)